MVHSNSIQNLKKTLLPWCIVQVATSFALRFEWFFFDTEGQVKKPEFTVDPKKPAAQQKLFAEGMWEDGAH